MKFGELKKGNTVYILNKDEMIVAEGQVQSVSFPHVGSTGSTMGMGVDIAIEANGKSATYSIPEGLTITYADSLTIATAREMLATEVQQMKQETERRFSSIENSVNGLKGMVQSLLDKLA